jgi:hypothetical protein
MELMQRLEIKNLSESVGRKYQITIDENNKMTSIVPIDMRVVTYADIEKIQK